MRLIDDITAFLEGNGFGCRHQTVHDHDVICTTAAGSGGMRMILPLEICALTQEDAYGQSIRTEECIRSVSKDNAYPLIITKDRWESQREMMKARLMAHLECFSTAYARNCEVRRIEKSEAQAFLNENHSYGYAACRYHYGMFQKRATGQNESDRKGKLLAVATFSNARKWVKEDKVICSYEWTRYASLPDLRINGGMGKMLKTFIAEIRPDDIMSYADLEWSEGGAYSRLGFRLEDRKEAVMFAIDPLTWKRSPTGKGSGTPEYRLYFRNFGSNKYRLKLTEYK